MLPLQIQADLMSSSVLFTRRGLLRLGGAAFAAATMPMPGTSQPASEPLRLRAALSRVHLAGVPENSSAVWAYNGGVPGPEIRVRQGEPIRVRAENGLAEETTVHWHGIRTPNAMDGVPHLTQAPIPAGGEFLYEFDAVDAGTFWYHPHQRSSEQVGRGLYGPLIIEEHDPIRVDRDLIWMLDDWRMTDAGEISDDFGNRHDAAHNGRVGNTVTINGTSPEPVAVRRGERVRLRLINAANARIFALDFGDLDPVIVALDGQPVTPHAPAEGIVVIGPAMRIDLVLDMAGHPGSRTTVRDVAYQGLEYDLVEVRYDEAPLRKTVPDWSLDLPANPLREPDIAAATRHKVVFNGGMMGQMMMGDDAASMMQQMRDGAMWFINGQAADGHVMDPLVSMALGTSHVFAMDNRTTWHHPIHLHGHSFRVIARNGEPTRYREWQDTVLVAPEETVEIAFVADNPGDWMFHCHILEHQAAGMMAVVRVGDGATGHRANL
ncbi:multicopper oxidase family protein [Allosediminivita pacifica]|nr:multicopper oxidase family protein [Allosediminivita pacifica]